MYTIKVINMLLRKYLQNKRNKNISFGTLKIISSFSWGLSTSSLPRLSSLKFAIRGSVGVYGCALKFPLPGTLSGVESKHTVKQSSVRVVQIKLNVHLTRLRR